MVCTNQLISGVACIVESKMRKESVEIVLNLKMGTCIRMFDISSESGREECPLALHILLLGNVGPLIILASKVNYNIIRFLFYVDRRDRARTTELCCCTGNI